MRTEYGVGDMVRNIHLQSNSGKLLLLQFKLRNLYRRVEFGILEGALAACMQVEQAFCFHIAGRQALQSTQADSLRRQLSHITLLLGPDGGYALQGAGCHVDCEIPAYLIPGSGKGKAGQPNLLIRYVRLCQHDATLSHQAAFRSMYADVCRQRSAHGKLRARNSLQIFNIKLRGMEFDLKRAGACERPSLQFGAGIERDASARYRFQNRVLKTGERWTYLHIGAQHPPRASPH